MNRRDFLQKSGALWALPPVLQASATGAPGGAQVELTRPEIAPDSLLAAIDLKPARWIWYPMGRCLPSTVVLLRREIVLDGAPTKASGRVVADSRYKLTVNGERVGGRVELPMVGLDEPVAQGMAQVSSPSAAADGPDAGGSAAGA